MLYRDIPTLEKEVPIVQENNILFAPARGSLFRILSEVELVTNFDAVADNNLLDGVQNAIVGLKTLIGGIIDFSASLTFEEGALFNTGGLKTQTGPRWEIKLDGVTQKTLGYVSSGRIFLRFEDGANVYDQYESPNFKASLICRFKDVYDPRVANRVLNRNHLVGALA